MDILVEKEKRIEEFIRILYSELCFEMSNNPKAFMIQKEFASFIKIYDNGYRHSYNRIFLVLNDIRKETKNSSESPFININANYEYIQSEILPKLKRKNSYQYKMAIKFFDHLLLEISRIDAWVEFERRSDLYEQRLKSSKIALDEYEKKISEKAEQTKQDIQNEISSIKYETDKIKTDFITILSIFVAIIMGFAGVVGFGGNILANLNNIIIYKAICMLLISGLILFNGIFLMLHIVAKLTGRSIAHHCIHYLPITDTSSDSNNNHDCESCQSDHCGIWDKVKIKFPYTAHFNKILINGLFFTLIAWALNHGELGMVFNNDITFAIHEYKIATYGGFIVVSYIAYKVLSKIK